MIGALKFVVNCEFFMLENNFQGTCFGHAFSKACQYGIVKEKVYKNLKYVSITSARFGHAFSKACQYGIVKEKVYKNLKYVSITSAQADLQKCITWF